MSRRLISLLLCVLVASAAAAYYFNWLWEFAFGPPVAVSQQTPADPVGQRQELRRENAARQAARRERDRRSPETLAAAARAGVPRPLSADEFDPATGTIHWPKTLRNPQFQQLRQEIERLTRELAGNRNRDRLVQLQEAAVALREQLKGEIRNLPTADYLASRRFLKSLAHWASQ